MANKESLIALKSASAVLDFANAEYGVSKKIKAVTLANGAKEVTLYKSDNSEFSGEGLTNLEAVADAVSKAFPA